MSDETLLSKKEDRFSLQLDEARKRGAASPAGIFALLGELDYYHLIENLIRGPITESQLITPFRWWLFFKGNALASIVGVILILLRISLLLPGQTLPYWFKFSFFIFVSAASIFAYGFLFMKYISFPGGATWVAVKYTLAGFTCGMFFSELLKAGVICATIYAKSWIGMHIYGRSRISDVLLELYYDELIGGYTDEILAVAACTLILVYFWIYFYQVSKQNRELAENGRPYDLLSAS